MTDRLPWFKCAPEKLLGALSAMTTDEGYIYVHIVLRIYEVGGPISDPVRALARRSGMTERRANAALGLLVESGKVNFTSDGKIDSVTTHETLRESWKLKVYDLSETRSPISPETRAIVAERAEFKCVYCGDDDGPFEVGHIHPFSRGGEHKLSNFAWACMPCNRSKGAKTLEEWYQ